ncbi:MAG TPA: DUF3987 domain-containing protein, partial [Rubricoccaceae bacterium]
HVEDLAGLRAELEASPHVLAVFLSVSGDGLKALVPVRVVDPDTGEVRLPRDDSEHKWTFTAARALFPSADADPSCKDVSRACFVSDDPGVYVNEDAEPVEADAPEPTARPAAAARRQGGGDPAPTDYERTRSALRAIPPRPPYHEWIRIIAAVLDAVGGSTAEAVALLCEWSPEETPGEYEAKMRGGLKTVKAATLFYLARSHGWMPVPSPCTSPGSKSPKTPKSPESPVASGETEEDAEAPPELEWEAFPVDLLPRAAADYIRAHAAAIGCDPAFVAIPVLGVLAASVGNSHRLQMKLSYEVTATLWLVVVALSGSHKSPALRAALRPVFRREKAAQEAWKVLKAQHDVEQSIWSSLSNKEKPNASKPIPPVRRRYRINDATVESVAVVHEENPRGVFLVRDELAAWIASFDRYSGGGGDAQTWIELAEGAPISIDRKNAEKPYTSIERPAVCVVGGTQPGVLRDKLTGAMFDSGLVARLLMVEPPRSRRRFTDADVEHRVFLAYDALVGAAYSRPDDGAALHLSAEASSLYAAFYAASADATDDTVRDERIRGALVKQEGYCARFALIFHVHDTPPGEEPGPVSLSAMARAVKLTLWFRRETIRLFRSYEFTASAVPDRDTRLCGALPETFAWTDVSDVWRVQRQGAFKVIKRLVERGLVLDEGHGAYSVSPQATGDFGDSGVFGDFGATVTFDMALLDAAIAAGAPPTLSPADPAGDGHAGDGHVGLAPVPAQPLGSAPLPPDAADEYPPVAEDPF